ncbi:MAG: ATP-binding protein [Rhodobacteraceae bacterium]|nr:ATP-binding protein [Paracoccaceae bacterium]
MAGLLDPTIAEVISAMAEGMPQPVIMIGPDERVLALSPAAAATFGGSDLIGRHFLTVLRNPDVIDAVAGVLRTGARQETRFAISDHAQETVFRAACAPLPLGGRHGVMVYLEDTSSLEAAGQMRRDFVANVSHELRTPLTALIGFIETLRGPARDDAEARDRFLETMDREAGRMNRLVLDLLSLSRVESEERVRPKTRADLVDVLKSVALSLGPLAQGAGVRLELDLKVPAGPVLGDQDQLMQVFTNLAENAIKYGASGGTVQFSLDRLAHDPMLRGPAYEASVEDFGQGIDAIHLHRLTERFYRADSHRSRDLGGTGLGLAIVKHIVNRHRGRLKIDSEPGRGSRFGVVIAEA